jgi:hypothetical protein
MGIPLTEVVTLAPTPWLGALARSIVFLSPLKTPSTPENGYAGPGRPAVGTFNRGRGRGAMSTRVSLPQCGWR